MENVALMDGSEVCIDSSDRSFKDVRVKSRGIICSLK